MGDYAKERAGNGLDAKGAGEAQANAGHKAALAEVVILLRDYPQWAIWLPASGGDWTAIRPASSLPPSPELPTIWVRAATASKLARLMRAGDEQLSGRGLHDTESGQRLTR
jgi:hypothetical protein